MTADEYVALADDAGLVYASDDLPGYTRVRRGSGFSYVNGGSTVTDEERTRIESLAIPPAWENVWIASNELAHVLATGYDAAGRKQYIYHPAWEEVRDAAKFDRTAQFGSQLRELRKRIDSDLRRHGLPREKVIALAVSVLDRTAIRVGNRRYLETNDSYGLTTLESHHVDVSGSHVVLGFKGKGGAEHEAVFKSRRLARLMAECQQLDGQTLFSYESDGEILSIGSSDVNDYLSRDGTRFTAKDMRTWGATSLVTGQLAEPRDADEEKEILRAIDHAAEMLNNTRAVCRDSYVHPGVLAAYRDGSLQDAWRSSRSGQWLSRSESATNRIL